MNGLAQLAASAKKADAISLARGGGDAQSVQQGHVGEGRIVHGVDGAV